MTKKCGFRIETENRLFIAMCDRDIEFFAKIKDYQLAANGLLTIIGDEYSHILLEWDVTENSNQSFDSSVQNVKRIILT